MKAIFHIFFVITLCWKMTFAQQPQWVWLNPSPTGNELTNVRFANSDVGWFIGTNGTIFKTINGGREWFSLPSPPRYDYTALYPLSEDELWASVFGYTGYQISPTFKLIFSSDGGSSWEVKADGETFFSDTMPPRESHIRDLFFVDSENGFAVGDSGFVLRTTDAGSHWTLLERSTSDHLRTVQFLDSLTGYIAGGDHRTAYCDIPPACPSYSHGTILKTTDGGNTWQIIYRDTLSIQDVFFLTPSLGWATGVQLWDEELTPRGASYILKTADGGETWDYYTQPFGLGSIFFINETHGWAISSIVARTTDGGKTWVFTSPLQRNAYLNSLHFTDALHGYSVGFGGVIIQTNDGGLTWQHYDRVLDIGTNNLDVHFINLDTGWIISSGRVYKTTDKGQHWEAQDATGDAIDCDKDGNCWVVGSSGNISHTSDAGDTWKKQTSGTGAFLKDVKFFNSNVGWAVGEGTILKTMNSGKSWFTQNVSLPISGYNQIVVQDSLRVWVYGIQASQHTMNSGMTWDATAPNDIRPVFFLNPDTGWAQGYPSAYRTHDGGKTWEPIRSVGGNSTFVNANVGWDNDSYIIRTTSDGGITWEIELKVDVFHALTVSLLGDGVFFVDALHGWAVGRGGALIRYGYPELMTSVRNGHVSYSKIKGFSLLRNCPNPFNFSTRIGFSIYEQAHVSLRIYDIAGRRIATLLDETKDPGHYEMEWSGLKLPSGIYFYRLSAGGSTQTKKMIILR